MTGSRAVLAVVRRFGARYPWRFAAGILLTAAAAAAGAGLLAVSGQLIAGAGLAGLGLIVFDTFGPSAEIRFFAVARTLLRYGERMASHDATLRFLADLRIDVFRGLAAGFRGTERPAVLFNRLTGDLDSLDGVMIRLAIPVIAGLLVLAGAAAILWTIDPVLALAVTVPIALGGLLAPLAAASRATAEVRRKLFALDAARVRIADIDRGRASLAASGGLATRLAGVEDAFDRAAAADLRLAALDRALRVAAGLGAHAGLVGAALAAAPLTGTGALTGLGFTAVLLAAFALGEVVAPVRGVALDFGRWAVAARRLMPLVGSAVAGLPPAAAALRPPGIELDRVAVRRPGAGAARLEDVRLSVAPGERVALVGPSGSGKSTVIGVLAGVVPAASGRVCLSGDAAPRIAWLGQRTELFRGTVAENLRLADPEADDERLCAVLRAARLLEALGPEGLGRRLGDEGSGLSGGERRRLALARLMLQEPDLVLLDEPTEGLDEETAAAVFSEILGWCAGRTLLYATHRPGEAALADRVVTVAAGRVVEVEAAARG